MIQLHWFIACNFVLQNMNQSRHSYNGSAIFGPLYPLFSTLGNSKPSNNLHKKRPNFFFKKKKTLNQHYHLSPLIFFLNIK